MTGCRAYGAGEVREALVAEVKRKGMTREVEVRATGCHGFCAKAPVISIEPAGIQYQEVSPEDAPEIVDLTLAKNRFIERLAYRDPESGNPLFYRSEIGFYNKQTRRVLANCGKIDPTNIEHYIVLIHKLGKLGGLRDCVVHGDAQLCEEKAFLVPLRMILNLFYLNWTY